MKTGNETHGRRRGGRSGGRSRGWGRGGGRLLLLLGVRLPPVVSGRVLDAEVEVSQDGVAPRGGEVQAGLALCVFVVVVVVWCGVFYTYRAGLALCVLLLLLLLLSLWWCVVLCRCTHPTTHPPAAAHCPSGEPRSQRAPAPALPPRAPRPLPPSRSAPSRDRRPGRWGARAWARRRWRTGRARGRPRRPPVCVFLFIYLFIFINKCVCVCVCVCR